MGFGGSILRRLIVVVVVVAVVVDFVKLLSSLSWLLICVVILVGVLTLTSGCSRSRVTHWLNKMRSKMRETW